MIFLLRLITSFGGLLLAVSFFIPFEYHNSPVRRFLWSVEGLTVKDISNAESLGFAVVIVYSYCWALIAAVTVWYRRARMKTVAFWTQMSVHFAGGGTLSVFGILLLVINDKGLPVLLQLAAAFVPLVLIGVMLSGALFVKPEKRVALVTVLGFLLQVPIQPVLAWSVYNDGGPPWGYVVGAIGAVVGLSGSLCVFLVEGVNAGNMHSNPNL